VESFDAGLEALIADMFASMHAANGVGLAANQIGTGLRVFVYDCPDAAGENQAGHVVNPVVAVPAAAFARPASWEFSARRAVFLCPGVCHLESL
jgi:peptide deformylase